MRVATIVACLGALVSSGVNLLGALVGGAKMTLGQARRLCKQIQRDSPDLQVRYRHYSEGDYYTLCCKDRRGGEFEICSPEDWKERLNQKE